MSLFKRIKNRLSNNPETEAKGSTSDQKNDNNRYDYNAKRKGLGMAFVNEYVSKEDIEKYGLVELCRQYKNDNKYTAVQDPEEIDWTIDKEREIWLIRLASVAKRDTDFPSPTNEKVFVLFLSGVKVELHLRLKNISKDSNDVPFKSSWEYLGSSFISSTEKNETVEKLADLQTIF